MEDHWETNIAGLLDEISSAQSDLLALLAEKRDLLADGDCEALSALQSREEDLMARLSGCLNSREELLAAANEAGFPSDSILSLADHLPQNKRNATLASVNDARSRARLLQHESLTNWVLIQRTLLHLSQMIEIIATGGQIKPTYGDGASDTGALVDRAV